MSSQKIENFRKVNDQLITGGQPSEAQLKAAALEGFQTVINLAPINPRYSLPDEARLVASLGMTYHHLPIDWAQPTESDFEAFEKLLATLETSKTLIHCAANFRVTAFYALYAMKNLAWSEARAEEFRNSVWAGSDYPIWEAFIAEMKIKIAG